MHLLSKFNFNQIINWVRNYEINLYFQSTITINKNKTEIFKKTLRQQVVKNIKDIYYNYVKESYHSNNLTDWKKEKNNNYVE